MQERGRQTRARLIQEMRQAIQEKGALEKNAMSPESVRRQWCGQVTAISRNA